MRGQSDCHEIMKLRYLLDRVYDELGEQMSPDLRNTIAKELPLPLEFRTLLKSANVVS